MLTIKQYDTMEKAIHQASLKVEYYQHIRYQCDIEYRKQIMKVDTIHQLYKRLDSLQKQQYLTEDMYIEQEYACLHQEVINLIESGKYPELHKAYLSLNDATASYYDSMHELSHKKDILNQCTSP